MRRTGDPVTLDPSGNVSCETAERLRVFVDLLLKWNARINLIGRSTEEEIQARHMADSLQILRFAPPALRRWVDLGSGGGFPGLVVAAVLADTVPEAEVHLVESDQRKATFLREAARAMAVRVTVHAARIEAVPPLSADVLSARALAPLTRLCGFARRHLAPGGVAILPKGANWREELAQAKTDWNFRVGTHPSGTATESAILVLEEISHV